MQLYAGSSTQFIEDTVQNQIANKLKQSFFFHFRYDPAPSEVNSWRNSLSKMKDVIQRSDLTDHGILLEYQLPLMSRRLDCMITGTQPDGQEQAVIVELKQWEESEPAAGDNTVTTYLGHGKRATLHPAVQVGQYEQYLRDCHLAFQGNAPAGLHSCSYLHNYTFRRPDALLAPKFRSTIEKYPLFPADGVDQLCSYLTGFLSGGEGMPLLERVKDSRFRSSKKLLDHVSGMIRAQREFILIDEQLIVYDQVMAAAREAARNHGDKTVIMIQGGPGTGKSVIAINLLAGLAAEGLNSLHATGSKAFTETLRNIVGKRAAASFKYFHNYAMAAPNELDVLVLDECHRIRKTSVMRFTPKDERSGIPQIDEIIKAAKVSVFFIDDLQVVRTGEVGSSSLIEERAKALGCQFQDYKLEAQFRCSGSDAFVNWINNTLGINPTANVIWQGDPNFEFKVFDSPEELDSAIRQQAAQGFSARVTAGYCWPWSRDTQADGTLRDDVVIGSYRRPWNARPGMRGLAKGIPSASLWATDNRGMDQVGCVYTAQGFEFDYAGVIFGKDLFYNPVKAEWEGRRDFNKDSKVRGSGDRLTELVKNTYRVLLSRGMKGCYVYFMDEETRNFFRSRMEVRESIPLAEAPAINPILTEVGEADQFVRYLPVYSLQAAAGAFGEAQHVRPLGWMEVPEGKLSKDMFIAKVKGRSMMPLIPDGSYCIFRWERGGSRNGRVVLVECQDLVDPESGGRYTVKTYNSEKELLPDGTWRHKKVILSPTNKEFSDIVLENVEAELFRVPAEFVRVIPRV